LACLTNFREADTTAIYANTSRGALPKAFLTLSRESKLTTEEFARYMVEQVGVSHVGGFSLVFGRLSKKTIGCAAAAAAAGEKGKGLAIISNRTEDASATTWICSQQDELHGLSNSHFGDRSWPKVVQGERLLQQVIQTHVAATTHSSKKSLIKDLFDVLSKDTLPAREQGQDWDAYVYQLRNSIFIPRIGGHDDRNDKDDIASTAATADQSKVYGTQKQTVILVDRNGTVTYIEKTLYDEQGQPTENNDIRQHEFDIEGWND
jgi:uncharacterized protein with NRDE domain